MTLSRWLRKKAIDDGERAGITTTESAENRELKRRARLLEQENEVLRGDRVVWRICRDMRW